MKTIRRAPAVLAAAAAAALIVSACGGGEASSTPENQTMVYGTLSYLSTLDPHKSTSVIGDCQVTCLLYDRLVREEPDGTLVGDLAESWEFSDDAKTLTFTLREGVTFNDGTALDAAAVKTSLDHALTDEKSTVKADLASISAVEAVDETTVELALSRPDVSLPGALSTVAGVIINPTALENGTDLSSEADGSGPFVLTSYEAGSKTVLERNEKYWGEAPSLDKLEIRGFTDASALTNALLAGQIDAANVQPGNLSPFEDNDKFEVETLAALGPAALITNYPLAELTDARVRQAILHAVDREGNCEELLRGYCEVTDQPFPEDYFANDDSIDQILYPYDPAKAKQLLKDAGVSTFEIDTSVANPAFVPYAEAVQAQLAEVGITMNLDTIDMSTMAQKLFMDKSLPSVLTTFAGRPDPAITIGHRYTKEGFYNPGGFTTDKIESLHADALSTSDPQAREAILKETSREVAETGLGMVFYQPVTAVVFSEGASFPIAVSGIHDLRTASNTGAN